MLSRFFSLFHSLEFPDPCQVVCIFCILNFVAANFIDKTFSTRLCASEKYERILWHMKWWKHCNRCVWAREVFFLLWVGIFREWNAFKKHSYFDMKLKCIFRFYAETFHCATAFFPFFFHFPNIDTYYISLFTFQFLYYFSLSSVFCPARHLT